MSPEIVVLVISTVVVLGLLLYYLHLVERRRKKALAGVARRLGLKFRGDYDETLVERATRFELKPWGWSPHAENLLHGRYRGHLVQVFDYQCVQQQGKYSKTVTATFFMVYLGKLFPTFLLYPETILDKAVQAIGLEDIDFDSIEFSRAFVVKSKDKKFAYDICNVLFMEHLLARQHLAVEIQGEYLALVTTPRVEPDKLVKYLDEIIDVRELMPAYLFA